MALPLNKEVAPANVNFENVEEVMKTSDYQKLRNAISDLLFSGVLFEEESKVYQRRLEDLWHKSRQKDQPVAGEGGAAGTEIREEAELAKTKGNGHENSSKSPARIDIRAPYQGRSVANKARFSQLFERLIGKRDR